MTAGGRSQTFRLLRAWALALLFGGAASTLAQHAYTTLPRPRPLEELSYYPSGRHLRPATLGHAETAADLAWLRAVQYYGEHRMLDNRFEKLGHVFDILTSLSPRFVAAYVFGGFSLAQEGQDFAAGERLMLKGLENNPRSGWLAFELGFMYFVRPGGRDLAKAAEHFELASYQPDAPAQARRFAAFARQSSGHLEASYLLWQHVRDTSPNHFLRESAAREMEKIARALADGRRGEAVHTLTVPRVQVGTRR